jgi:hypothetical protein
VGASRSCAVAGAIVLVGAVLVRGAAAAGTAASDRETADAHLRGYAAATLERDAPIEDAPPPRESGRSDAGSDAESDPELGLLPPGELFRPLIADPRWPHTSAAYQRYFGDGELRQAGAPTFGESFALWRGASPDGGRWELGLQGGVFSIFDLEAESLDLVNADYLAGLTVAYQRGDFAALLRGYHQSSHLGDEFLLRDSVERVNLSYEVTDALLSYELGRLARIYGGGGYVVHRDPADLAPGLLQAGVELVSPYTLAEGVLRPLAALDLKWAEESGWETDRSVRAGFQIENPGLRSLKLQLLAEYYRGRSPNGQFFVRDVEYAGFGIHLYF